MGAGGRAAILRGSSERGGGSNPRCETQVRRRTALNAIFADVAAYYDENLTRDLQCKTRFIGNRTCSLARVTVSQC